METNPLEIVTSGQSRAQQSLLSRPPSSRCASRRRRPVFRSWGGRREQPHQQGCDGGSSGAKSLSKESTPRLRPLPFAPCLVSRRQTSAGFFGMGLVCLSFSRRGLGGCSRPAGASSPWPSQAYLKASPHPRPGVAVSRGNYCM